MTPDGETETRGRIPSFFFALGTGTPERPETGAESAVSADAGMTGTGGFDGHHGPPGAQWSVK
jgi:hypothetical protein